MGRTYMKHVGESRSFLHIIVLSHLLRFFVNYVHISAFFSDWCVAVALGRGLGMISCLVRDLNETTF